MTKLTLVALALAALTLAACGGDASPYKAYFDHTTPWSEQVPGEANINGGF